MSEVNPLTNKSSYISAHLGYVTFVYSTWLPKRVPYIIQSFLIFIHILKERHIYRESP